MGNPKYSIVIATKDHLDDCLKPCLESIKKYTNMDEVEVIVVANGCTDSKTDEYVESLGKPFYLISYAEALGYPKANNMGIFDGSLPTRQLVMRTLGEYVVLLNNDTILLEQPKNQWLDLLRQPFEKDPKVGITGPLKGPSAPAGRDFIIFFCAMIRRDVMAQVGPLNEIFGVGGGEDTDYCIRVENAGYKTVQVPDESSLPVDPTGKRMLGQFPIYHAGGTTVSNNPKWDEIFKRNSMILAKKYNPEYHKWLLSNTCERAVFGAGDDIKQELFRRECTRYQFAADRLRTSAYNAETEDGRETPSRPLRVLEIGCSSGYGTRFFPEDIDYTGIDYDEAIINYAKEEYPETTNKKFYHMDVHKIPWDEWGHFDTIVAFEVLEHIHDGKEMAQELKKHCDNLMITTPYREPPGLWGPHHVLHRLSEADFPGFDYWFIHENGDLDRLPDNDNGINLQIMQWEKGKEYVTRERILCSISTKDRYAMLAIALQAVANQTHRPDKVVVFDDGEQRDLRNDPIYKHIFAMFQAKGIEWEVVFGEKKGQHFNHQRANYMGYPLVWRVDDDEVPDPDVLEKLLSHMAPDVGAVGGAVFVPGGEVKGGSEKLEDIYNKPNIQWHAENKVLEVDHLYSSFLYRAGIVSYRLDLSPMAHREETIFTHMLKREGYRLLVDLSARTYHYQQQAGGIRSEDIHTQINFERDERIFSELMEYWGYKLINLDVGLGDHLVFLNILPALKKRYKHLMIGCAYPDVFTGQEGVKIMSVAEARKWNQDNVYRWMAEHQWKRTILEAYAAMYNVRREDIHENPAASLHPEAAKRNAECEVLSEPLLETAGVVDGV